MKIIDIIPRFSMYAKLNDFERSLGMDWYAEISLELDYDLKDYLEEIFLDDEQLSDLSIILIRYR